MYNQLVKPLNKCLICGKPKSVLSFITMLIHVGNFFIFFAALRKETASKN